MVVGGSDWHHSVGSTLAHAAGQDSWMELLPEVEAWQRFSGLSCLAPLTSKKAVRDGSRHWLVYYDS